MLSPPQLFRPIRAALREKHAFRGLLRAGARSQGAGPPKENRIQLYPTARLKSDATHLFNNMLEFSGFCGARLRTKRRRGGRLGLKSMSLEQLMQLIDAARGEARR